MVVQRFSSSHCVLFLPFFVQVKEDRHKPDSPMHTPTRRVLGLDGEFVKLLDGTCNKKVETIGWPFSYSDN